jgi:hypothetical protein
MTIESRIWSSKLNLPSKKKKKEEEVGSGFCLELGLRNLLGKKKEGRMKEGRKK